MHRMNESVFLTNTVTLLPAKQLSASRILTMYVSSPSALFFPISCQLTYVKIKLML